MTGGGDLDEINDDDTLLDGDAETVADDQIDDDGDDTAPLGTDTDPTAGASDVGGRAGDADES